jgi:hypothetical protein
MHHLGLLVALVLTRPVLPPMSSTESVTIAVRLLTTPISFPKSNLVRVAVAPPLFKVVLSVPIKVERRAWALPLDELVAWRIESLLLEKVSEPFPLFFDHY